MRCAKAFAASLTVSLRTGLSNRCRCFVTGSRDAHRMDQIDLDFQMYLILESRYSNVLCLACRVPEIFEPGPFYLISFRNRSLQSDAHAVCRTAKLLDQVTFHIQRCCVLRSRNIRTRPLLLALPHTVHCGSTPPQSLSETAH